MGPQALMKLTLMRKTFWGHTLLTAELSKVCTAKNLGVQREDTSPLHVCPICSSRADAREYDVSLSMDVVNKVSHFAHAGNDMNLSPHLKNFLGKGEQEVVERASRGSLAPLSTWTDA
ncbi:hypothetical protein DUNSADRAFT_1847 [Dunaliella salina]|uniref:Encoded protein n=1 Tax=Dunaliella salina TaxID=3046 RepID=A0ABQ7GWI3_DUNSA|nr:hypothetical protein DUNSADRAFT_1847 [Dunaliella salina]|eukprot:KAF5838980.1 hypothetical protein DUNSADRAFT_1847 [Dunaliella salina]